MPRKRPTMSLPSVQAAAAAGDTLPKDIPGGEGVDSAGFAPVAPPAEETEQVPILEPRPSQANPEATPKVAFMEGILKCHTCGRTGEDDRGECPNLAVPGWVCPEPTPVDEDSDVVLHSPTLGITRTVPVAELVKGRAMRFLPGCHTDDCGYKVLHPKKA